MSLDYLYSQVRIQEDYIEELKRKINNTEIKIEELNKFLRKYLNSFNEFKNVIDKRKRKLLLVNEGKNMKIFKAYNTKMNEMINGNEIRLIEHKQVNVIETIKDNILRKERELVNLKDELSRANNKIMNLEMEIREEKVKENE